MTQTIQESVKMLEMLPESAQKFANEFIKRLVLAWDPDYTKLTPEEREKLKAAEQRIDNGEFVNDSNVNWD